MNWFIGVLCWLVGMCGVVLFLLLFVQVFFSEIMDIRDTWRNRNNRDRRFR